MKRGLLLALVLTSGCSGSQLRTGIRLVGMVCELAADIAGQDELEYLCASVNQSGRVRAKAAEIPLEVRVRVPRAERAAFERAHGVKR